MAKILQKKTQSFFFRFFSRRFYFNEETDYYNDFSFFSERYIELIEL